MRLPESALNRGSKVGYVVFESERENFNISLKLQEYHSYRSLIVQENHLKINVRMHTLMLRKLEHQRSNTGTYTSYTIRVTKDDDTWFSVRIDSQTSNVNFVLDSVSALE